MVYAVFGFLLCVMFMLALTLPDSWLDVVIDFIDDCREMFRDADL